MDILNISLDDNEADTSQDELDENDEETLRTALLGSVINVRNGTLGSSTGSNELKSEQDFIKKEFQSWMRPEIPEGSLFYSSSVLQEQPDPFHFFMIDSVSTVTRITHPGITLDNSVKDLPIQNVIRLFGVTRVPKKTTDVDDGFIDCDKEEAKFSASVCCNVHGFLPYFYALPTGKLSTDRDYWLSSQGDNFIHFLNKKIKDSVLNDISGIEEYSDFLSTHPCVLRIEVLNSKELNCGIYHFHVSSAEGVDLVVLKIYCSLPIFVWKAHAILENAIYEHSKFQTFESNMNNNVRFLTDQNLPGCSWLAINPGKFFHRHDSGQLPCKETYCQIEIDVHYKDIICLPNDNDRYSSNPPLRILSFDIEVMVSPKDLNSPKDGFRQIIQIGNVLGNYYEGANGEDSIIGKTAFVLGTCDAIPDTKVIQFYVKENPESTNEEFLTEAESRMLAAWRNFVIQMDPDIIIGYNIKKFDIPYLIDRANKLNQFEPARSLPFLGRMKKMKCQIRPLQNSMKKVHPYDEKNVNIQGRIVMDLYPVLVRHDRKSYGKGYFKLSNVAKRFLPKSEEKQDVHYSEIEGLQHGDSVTRSRLAKYCIQDSIIPLLLLFEPVPCRSESIRFIELYFKKSNIGGNLLRYLFNKSMSYNDYFKQVRVQKNPGKVIFVPETPSPKKSYYSRTSAAKKTATVAKNLFTAEASTSKSLSSNSTF